MKLTIIFLTAAFLHVSAAGFSQNITFSGRKVSLEKVFSEVKKQTGLVFFYEASTLEGAKEVTINAENIPLEDFLTTVLKDQPFRYSIQSKTITISRKLNAASLPSMGVTKEMYGHVISGYVSAEDGTRLEGASVRIKGKSSAYGTDASGRYSMDAEPGDILVVSYIGYETKQITVGESSTLNVILQRRAMRMDTANITVSTGYQTLTKERATGSFAKPDMKVFANRTSSMDLISRLDGLVPGMLVLHGNDATNASPTGRGTVTQEAIIRGNSSVQLATTPLYVVDGVAVSDFQALNLDDVADITVLKDAAAAAIWGARAANGVIVVTTKSGTKDQKIRVSYSGFVNFEGKPDLSYRPVLNSKQFIQAARDVFDSTSSNGLYAWSSLSRAFIAPHEVILYNKFRGLITTEQANASLDSLANINNSSQIKDIFYQNAITTNHTVSVSGGGSTYNFYGSLGYTGVQGQKPGDKQNTYRFDFSQEFNPNRNIKISLKTSLAQSQSSSKDVPDVGSEFFPYQLFRDANGKTLNMNYMAGFADATLQDYASRSRINLDYNPVDEMNYGHSENKTLYVNIVANAGIKLYKGLSFQGTYGYTTSPGSVYRYDDIKGYRMRKQLVDLTVAPTVNSLPVYYLPTTGGAMASGTNNQRNWTVRNQLLYNYSGRNGNDQLNIQFGQDANEQMYFRTTSNVIGYDERLQTYAMLDNLKLEEGIPGTVTGTGYYSMQPFQTEDAISRFTSWFGLASYTFNKKYSIDGSWRQDHSNLFGSDLSSQNRPVWSVGGKWNIGREDFMRKAGWINELMIRATYGITGNSPEAGQTSSYDILNVEQVYNGTQIGGPSYALSDPANTKLNWETTVTKNFGVDFAMFNGRLSGSVDYYRKTTTDLLGSMPLNPFTGYSSANSNIGNLTNNGIELSLRSVNLRLKDFTWSTGFVFSYNKNKLVTYRKPSYEITAYDKVYETDYFIGYSLNPMFAYRFAGLNNVGDPMIFLSDKSKTTAPESAAVEDVKYMGSTVPVYNGGLTNTFSYKGFDLSVNMVYNFGAMMRRDVNTFYTNRLTGSRLNFSGNKNAGFADRWKKPGDELFTNVPSYRAKSAYNSNERDLDYYEYGDVNVLSASYVKIRDIALAYHLNKSTLHWLKLQGASLRFQVNNFMVWKANKYNIDPEAYSFVYGSRSLSAGTHAITIGANVNF